MVQRWRDPDRFRIRFAGSARGDNGEGGSVAAGGLPDSLRCSGGGVGWGAIGNCQLMMWWGPLVVSWKVMIWPAWGWLGVQEKLGSVGGWVAVTVS